VCAATAIPAPRLAAVLAPARAGARAAATAAPRPRRAHGGSQRCAGGDRAAKPKPRAGGVRAILRVNIGRTLKHGPQQAYGTTKSLTCDRSTRASRAWTDLEAVPPRPRGGNTTPTPRRSRSPCAAGLRIRMDHCSTRNALSMPATRIDLALRTRMTCCSVSAGRGVGRGDLDHATENELARLKAGVRVQALDLRGSRARVRAAGLPEVAHQPARAASYFHEIMSMRSAFRSRKRGNCGGADWWTRPALQIGNGPFTFRTLEPDTRARFARTSATGAARRTMPSSIVTLRHSQAPAGLRTG